MIHVFGLEPQLVASWGQGGEYRFINANFGLGTPRAMLEVRKFHKWKREVLREASDRDLTELQRKRVDEMLQIFDEHRYQRVDTPPYDGNRTWLENAEHEHDRKDYKGILATSNPRDHRAVVVSNWIDPHDERWHCPLGVNPARSPEALRDVLGPMIASCDVLHLVDPHFGPDNSRHRNVLAALIEPLASGAEVNVHCTCSFKDGQPVPSLDYFQKSAAKLARRLPSTITVRFLRWKTKAGRDRLHNRYVMTKLGGVLLGIGLDSGQPGETDDACVLTRDQYQLRWKQYVTNDGTFELVDTPRPIHGTGHPHHGRPRR